MDFLRPFIDDEAEINTQLYASDSVMASLACLPWAELMDTPLTISLPDIIVWKPKDGKNLPRGKLWGILMEFHVSDTKRPKADGTVFVCGDQKSPPPNIFSMEGLWNWAMDTKNCPATMRFYSLRYALKVLCSETTAPYPVAPTRKDGYFTAMSCWAVAEWGLTIDKLLRMKIPFFPYSEDIPQSIKPSKPKNTGRKRNRTIYEDPVKFMETFSFKKVDLQLISPHSE
jgi:hypothetical protein